MAIRVLPVAAPLVSLLFISTSVVALVNVTANCTLGSFKWVCALWFRCRQYLLWPHRSDGIVSRPSTLSAKVHAWSLDTCLLHVTGGVSFWLIACVGIVVSSTLY